MLLIDDEEFSGFLRCNGEPGLSFTDVNNIGVANRYWENRSFIREPVYFKVRGIITEDGKAGWGMTGEPWDQNIEILEILTVLKGKVAHCTKARLEREITTEYDKPEE